MTATTVADAYGNSGRDPLPDPTGTARAEAWLAAHDRVRTLALRATAAERGRPVPATPDWSVQDLVAHMAAVGLETLAGTAVTGHPPTWTAETVASARGKTMEQIVADWDEGAAGIAALVAGAEPSLLIDLAVHEQDLRDALDRPGARTGDSFDAMFAYYVGKFLDAAQRLPPLRIDAGDRRLRVGAGDTDAVLVVDPFDLQRAACGRRSEAQVRAWNWPAEPSPYLDKLSAYGKLADTDILN